MLPLKTRILEYAINKDAPVTVDEITDALSKEYVGERFCNKKNIDKLIGTYCGVGVMEASKIEFDNNKQLDIEYVVTNFGKAYKRYIPDSKHSKTIENTY